MWLMRPMWVPIRLSQCGHSSRLLVRTCNLSFQAPLALRFVLAWGYIFLDYEKVLTSQYSPRMADYELSTPIWMGQC